VFLQDARYAVRSFVRAPGFTPIGLVTLPRGIGPTSASRSVADRILLRSLTHPDPDPIVTLIRVSGCSA
jgi:hypothetical protein